MIILNNVSVDHPFGELEPLHGFVKKSERESIQLKKSLGKDYGHSCRAVPCLSHSDFPQAPCPTAVSRLNFFRLVAMKRNSQGG